jgi:ankyrin repeat protein
VALVRETLRNTDVDANQLVARTNVLHDACRVGGKEVVVVLVQEFHAEVNKKSMVPIVINTSLPYELNHHTPLSLAAGSGCEELVHWLIEHGARLEMDDCAGCLIAASEKGAPGLVRLFLDKLKPFWPSTGWAAGLLGLGDTTAKSQTLETTFLTAIEKAAISDVAALRVLLADVPVSVVRKATTALNKAIRESNAPAVAELLKHGVPPTKGAGVWGPIHDAAMIGDLEVIRLLVQHGADAGMLVPSLAPPLVADTKEHRPLQGLLCPMVVSNRMHTCWHYRAMASRMWSSS